jgi:hypothetical protein
MPVDRSGKPSLRWLEDVQNDLRELKVKKKRRQITENWHML